jgi:predicted RNA-binding Zn-ribbon protein involved in translation (DUF1610 family)
MALKEPESMDDLIYFTNRTLGNGTAKVWVYKQLCPKCHKSKIGKPVENGKVRIRATEYVCKDCGFSAEKTKYEESLEAEAKYTCPACGFAGEAKIPFIRKNIEGVKTLRFNCSKCKANIDVTKKMKEPKKKKGKGAVVPVDDDE